MPRFTSDQETIDCLSVNSANDVLPLGVVNDGVRIFFVQMLVANPLIGAEQADFVRDGFADKLDQSIGADVRSRCA